MPKQRYDRNSVVQGKRYQPAYILLPLEYDVAKSKYEELDREITARQARVQAMESFIANIDKQNPLNEFDEDLWGLLVESVTVYSKDDIRVKFKD